jgi:hypothetical protein
VIENLTEVIEFIHLYENGNLTEMKTSDLYQLLSKHNQFGTLIVCRDEKGIYAVVRWNYVNHEIFYCPDLIIRPDCRGIDTFKKILQFGVNMSPFKKLKYILYRKGQHYELGYRLHEIRKLLGKNYKLEVDV